MTSEARSNMHLVAVSDGNGGTRHEWRTRHASSGRKKKDRRAPDPINANPEAAAQQLRQIIERIERLEEEERGIKDDKKDVYSEAKSIGFDTKVVRKIVEMRRIDPHIRRELEAILETYKCALQLD